MQIKKKYHYFTNPFLPAQITHSIISFDYSRLIDIVIGKELSNRNQSKKNPVRLKHKQDWKNIPVLFK